MSKKKHYHSNKRKMSARKKALITVGVIFALAMAVGLGGIFFINSMLNHVNKETDDHIISREEQDFETDGKGPDTMKPEDMEWDADTDVMKDNDIKNILLIGQDRRPGQGRQRSDTMIICSVNRRTDKITLVSLMRDMYVPIPGFDDNRINAAYAFGGMKLLDQTIEKDFGVHIDGNVEVDFDGFIKTMSKVGDLKMTLTQEEADYINNDLKRGSLKAGENTLDAEQTLLYARIRKVGNGDYERSERQRKVLMAAFDKIRQSDLMTTLKLAKKILPNFTTDLSNRQIMGYIYTVVSNNITIDKETYRIPDDDAFTSERIRGMAVLVPDLKENRKVLRWYLYGVPVDDM